MQFKLSVVMPIYNAEQYIREAVDSVIQSNGFEENIQLIFVNDGSPDNCGAICEEYQARYPKNILYINKPNGGLCSARNAGLDVAQAPLVNFMDPDDYVDADLFEKEIALMDKHPEIDYVCARKMLFEARTGLHILDDKFQDGDGVIDIAKNPSAFSGDVNTSSIRMSAIGDARFDERLKIGEDCRFITPIILKKGHIGVIASSFYHLRKRFTKNSETQKDHPSRYKETMEGWYAFAINLASEYPEYAEYLYRSAMHGLRGRFRRRPNSSEIDFEAYRACVKELICKCSDSAIATCREKADVRLKMFEMKYGAETVYEEMKVEKGEIFFRDFNLGALPAASNVCIRGVESCKDKIFISGLIKVPFENFSLRYRFGEVNKKIGLTRQPAFDKIGLFDEPILKAYSFCVSLPIDDEVKMRFVINTGKGPYRSNISWDAALKSGGKRKKTGVFSLSIVDEKRNLIIEKAADFDDEPSLFSWPDEKSKARAIDICSRYKMSAEECFANDLFKLDGAELIRKCTKIANRRAIDANTLERLVGASGFGKARLIKRKALSTALYGKTVSFRMMEAFGLWRYDKEDLGAAIQDIEAADKLCCELKASIKDADNESFGDAVHKKYEQYMHICEQLLDEAYLERVSALLGSDLGSKHLTVDMFCTRSVLGYLETEYANYRFENKSLEERAKYLSSAERLSMQNKINAQDALLKLNDKGASYELFKEYYKRDALALRSSRDFAAFKEFTSKHKTFIAKPANEASGTGVSCETVSFLNKQKVFDKLLTDGKAMVVEELVLQNEALSAFNASSINTVRLCTMRNGDSYKVGYAFIRFGRAGSLVDNGGQGGIFAAVDAESGKVISDGYDEWRGVYEKHPDSNMKFNGFQLPNWSEALSLVKAASEKLPSAKLVGWDLACQKDGTWCIIEANGKMMFIAQQTCAGRGLRKEFIEFIG